MTVKSMTTETNPSAKRNPGWLLALAFSVPMVFALFTQNVWEDYYITFRASKNLAEGHGLVFQIGERLHTFTSPLGVLLPAALSWLTHSDTAALWLFRIISSTAFAGAAGMMWSILRVHGAGTPARWISLIILLSSTTAVAFTINGMETGLLLFFCMMTFSEMTRPDGIRVFRLGLALAGMMWTRPDAFVPAGALMLGALVFIRPASASADGKTLGAIGRALAWAAAIYGPWVAWAWWYYGSPVPNTIIAKAGLSPKISFPGYLFSAPFKYITGDSSMNQLFAPIYSTFGGWPPMLISLFTVMAIVSGFLWLFPKVNRVGRAASLMVFIGSFYLQAIPLFPWYLPVWILGGAMALGCGVETCLNALKPQSLGRRLLRSGAVIVMLMLAAGLGLSAWQTRQQQRLIEDGNRHAIGLWLASHAKPGDTVMLECLGYIGYYSQLKMLDYPGLSSHEVVEARRTRGLKFTGMIGYLKPDWIVLRPQEYLVCDEAHVLGNYRIEKVWDAQSAIDAIDLLPGRAYLSFDAVFLVLRRQATPLQSPQP